MRGKRGFTLIEMVVTVAVLSVVLAIALPHMSKMYMMGNESAVVEAMRTVNRACDSWQMQGLAAGGFPLTLRVLVQANPPYLDGRFAAIDNGNWKSYLWVYTAGPLIQRQVGNVGYQFRDSYTLRADPSVRGFTGQRSFFMDQTGVVRFNTRGPAGPNDTPLEQAED